MKALTFLLTISMFSVLTFTSNAQTKSRGDDKAEVKVYYFHNSNRCATCMAVESKSLAAIKELYPQQLKEGKITFTALNIEESDGKSTAKKLGVDGQCLLVVKGDTQIDLTDKAFLYCNVSPEKLTAALKDAVGKI